MLHFLLNHLTSFTSFFGYIFNSFFLNSDFLKKQINIAIFAIQEQLFNVCPLKPTPRPWEGRPALDPAFSPELGLHFSNWKLATVGDTQHRGPPLGSEVTGSVVTGSEATGPVCSTQPPVRPVAVSPALSGKAPSSCDSLASGLPPQSHTLPAAPSSATPRPQGLTLCHLCRRWLRNVPR